MVFTIGPFQLGIFHVILTRIFRSQLKQLDLHQETWFLIALALLVCWGVIFTMSGKRVFSKTKPENEWWHGWTPITCYNCYEYVRGTWIRTMFHIFENSMAWGGVRHNDC
jgi:hypothetical protein